MKTVLSGILTAAALAATAAEFAPADMLIYTRWRYVRDEKTGEVSPDRDAYHHESTEQGAEEMRRYFTANGRSCLVTDDPAVFVSDAMKGVKCIVLACTNHELTETPAQLEAFYRFIEEGGGLLAIHSASANERGKERFRRMLGGAFERHYPDHQSVPFSHADRTHPAIACLPADYVWADDEIYLNHPDEQAIRPLLVLDWKDVLEKSRRDDTHGCPPSGGHVLEWCKTYGKGRIYYTALGHNGSDFGKMEWQLHLFRAACWAAGELPDRVGEAVADGAVRKTLDGCELVSGGRTVWKLNLATRESKPFVHPLCLPDGRCITEARTADHPWHLGLWFCWKYINGLNYWEPRDPAAENLFPDGQTVIRDFDIRPKGAACEVSLDLWYGPRAEPGRVLLDERREIAFSAPDARGGYAIRSRHRFTAREEVTFDCRRPVGYGGFSLRMDALVRSFEMSGEGGEPDSARNVAGPKGMRAVTCRDPKSGHGVTVRIVKGAPSERLYTWSDHRFANPVPMYDAPIVLKAGETLELEYEVVVF